MPKVALLSLTAIADDPRVRRQGDALTEAGHDVVGVGLSGAASPPPAWPISTVAPPSGRRRLPALAGKLLAVRVMPTLAERVYWSIPLHRELFDAAAAQGADVYHCNDWRVLPIGARLAERSDIRYVYDSHELGIEEESDKRWWQLLFPPYIRALESKTIGGAGFVSTVGDGIAKVLQQEYGLLTRPLVIRNTPAYAPMPFHTPGSPLVVLYQGVFNEDRALDSLIESVRFWDGDRRLVLRGFGKATFERRLRHIAEQAGVADRVTFAPAAPMTELISLANEADVGIHPIPPTTRQTRFCLPNKLFEYIMAGLALCVSGVPEMKRIVDDFGVGVTFESSTPESIASAVNELTPQSIADFKRQSLLAAQHLSWDTERSRLLDAYVRLLAR